jgi:site-specific DNA-methyltransferase (adenine-specific)
VETSLRPYYEHAGITIYHGDCREVLPGLRADLLLTDPPYGIAYEHGARKGGVNLGFDGHSIVGDESHFDPRFLLEYSDMAIIWGANHFSSLLPDSREWLVWDKREGIPPNDQSDCEMAWTNFLNVARLYSRYWNGGGISEERYHVNQKPIKLMQWAVTLAKDCETILDPFMGSGTTLRAAKDLGRRAIGIEIEEKYCEIAAKRLGQEVFEFEVKR